MWPGLVFGSHTTIFVVILMNHYMGTLRYAYALKNIATYMKISFGFIL